MGQQCEYTEVHQRGKRTAGKPDPERPELETQPQVFQCPSLLTEEIEVDGKTVAVCWRHKRALQPAEEIDTKETG
jgi:hypothetical protein